MIDWRSELFWSIDPGESKCGIAIFDRGRCVQAVRSTPPECVDKLWEHLGHAHPTTRPRGVVLERFELRGDLAAQQRGSEMGTSQMIGVVRWMCRDTDTPLVMQTPQNAHAIEQRTAPFDRWAQRRFTSYGQGRDAKMAELHGYFRISTSLSMLDRSEWHRSLLD